MLKSRIQKWLEFGRLKREVLLNRKLATCNSPIEKILLLGIYKLNKDLFYEIQVNYQIDYYFVDFAFPNKKIIIECDGYWHHQNIKKDLRRQKKIEKYGWIFIRFTGSEINYDTEGCIEKIIKMVDNV